MHMFNLQRARPSLEERPGNPGDVTVSTGVTCSSTPTMFLKMFNQEYSARSCSGV
jgi:hypothetical protein